MRSLFIFLSALSILLFTACAGDNKYSPGSLAFEGSRPAAANPGDFARLGVPSFRVGKDWRPESVDLICGANSCPAQIGVILFTEVVDAAYYNVHRCTATLIDVDKIVTSAHCDFSANSAGYFVTRSDQGTRQVQKIRAAIFKIFTQVADDPRDTRDMSGRPDAVIFQLGDSIKGIAPLKLATGAARTYTKMNSFVVNVRSKGTESELQIDPLNCIVHRHEQFYPYDLSEAPDVIYAFGCHGVEGNSGAPVFGDGGADIEAILQGFIDREKNAVSIRENQKREPLPYEIHDFSELTNVRCFDYPVKAATPCLKVFFEESQRRYTLREKAVFEQLKQRQPPGNFAVQFTANAYSLTGNDHDYQIDYDPKCRRAEFQQFSFPAEHVQLVIDDWGDTVINVLASQASVATIQARQGDLYTFNVTWLAPFRPFVEPGKELSQHYGPSFSIALPPCPR